MCAAESGELESQQCAQGQTCPCIFEYIYLARPDSVLNDVPVYSFQLGLGTRLAERIRCAFVLHAVKGTVKLAQFLPSRRSELSCTFRVCHARQWEC